VPWAFDDISIFFVKLFFPWPYCVLALVYGVCLCSHFFFVYACVCMCENKHKQSKAINPVIKNKKVKKSGLIKRWSELLNDILYNGRAMDKRLKETMIGGGGIADDMVF
jgi:hypothetical protein